MILRISQAAETISFAALGERQKKLVTEVRKDPAVENVVSFIGVDGVNTTPNVGRIQITLKPLEERKASALQVIRRLQPLVANVEGIQLFMPPVQDLTIEDR